MDVIVNADLFATITVEIPDVPRDSRDWRNVSSEDRPKRNTRRQPRRQNTRQPRPSPASTSTGRPLT
jgi:hypothetical protein